MSLFSTRFIYTYQKDRSKEFMTASGAVREGAEKVNDHPFSDSFRVSLDGNEGIKRDFKGAKQRAVQLLDKKPIGSVVKIECIKDEEVLDTVRFRKVLIGPPVKDTRGPVGLDRVEGWIEFRYPKARFAGDCVCKPNSDHADCAAVDYFDSEDNMLGMLNDVLADADYFNLKYAILFDRIYFPGGSSKDYDGIYHAHIHVSVTGGTPNAAC